MHAVSIAAASSAHLNAGRRQPKGGYGGNRSRWIASAAVAVALTMAGLTSPIPARAQSVPIAPPRPAVEAPYSIAKDYTPRPAADGTEHLQGSGPNHDLRPRDEAELADRLPPGAVPVYGLPRAPQMRPSSSGRP
jgi:hypothetical protein